MIMAPPAAENLFILLALFWLSILAYLCCCILLGSYYTGSTDCPDDWWWSELESPED
jgi:hypothetical protein